MHTWHIYMTPHGLWASETKINNPDYVSRGRVQIQEAQLYVGSDDDRRRHYATIAIETYKTTLSGKVSDHERQLIESALREHSGDVQATAKALGMSRRNIYARMRALGLDPDEYRSRPPTP